MMSATTSNSETPDTNFISWQSFRCCHVSSQLSFLLINSRSLANKFNEIEAKIANLKEKITFIVITETHLNSSRDVCLEIQGYNSKIFYRDSDHLGGGIKIYYLDHISVEIIPNFYSRACEYIVMKADVPGFGKLCVCSIYRPPQANCNDFFVFIESIFQYFRENNVIILGDMNINVLDTNSQVSYYNNLLESYGYKNEIYLPTHVNQSTHVDGSCLDHIVHNMPIDANSYVLYPNISDHYAVAALFPIDINGKLIDIKFRDFSQANITKFQNNVEHEFSRFSSSFQSVDDFADYTNYFLKKLLDKYFPIKMKRISPKKFKTPWITKKIRLCIKKKHHWYHLSMQHLISHESYKLISKKLKELIDVAKSEYYTNKLHSLRTDNKNSWKILNKLLGKKTNSISDRFNVNGNILTDPQKIATEFNNYFISHPAIIQENIPDSSRNFSNLVSMNQISANFEVCSSEEISLEISKIKKTGGIHDISGKFIKLCSLQLSEILSNLFNRCISEGIYPLSFKTAKITPVFKKGSRNEISNHRPISVLPNLSKVFDSIIYKRVKSFFEINGLLNPDQFGFRSQRNTELAIFTLLERIIPSFQNPSFSIVVFLDFSACFDTVHRGNLLQKLERYGIRDIELSLISSYFENRNQCVIYNGSTSSNRYQNIGTIQGSKTGPLYFDIYSGDLAKLCFEDEFIMFADDTCLTYSGDNLSQLISHVNERLALIYDWCCHNKLALNAEKCKFMIFTNKKFDSETIPPLKLGSGKIDRSNNFKYLGIYLDEKLDYNVQLKSLESRLSRMCGITYKINSHLNLSSAKNVYFSCIYSILTYCICIWGGTLSCSHRADRLMRLQVRCVKNLFYRFCPPNVCIFKHMNILKLNDLHSFYAGIYMYKIIKLNQCPTVQMNLNLIFSEHGYNTRNVNNPRTPFPRVNAVRMNYNFQLVAKWNVIPDHIKSHNSISRFKSEFMKYLVNNY